MPERILDQPVRPATPEVAISSTSTAVNRTGSWKYIRPVYQDRVAPCNAGCPVGIDIQGYLALLADGHPDEAVDLLLRENPMPAVTGRVCNHPCEGHCNRAPLDGAVAIHSVERMLGDRLLAGGLPEAVAPRYAQRVAVVGSGPAGLACAYHLTRLGYPVTVFERDEQPGGMLRQGIPGYRLPRTVLDRQIAHFKALGISLLCGVEAGTDVSWEQLAERFSAVFVGSGAQRGRPLGVEGEDLPGVRQGLAFLHAANRGKRAEVGRRVVVIGGGNTAMDCARTARRLGADVTVLYRRTREEMPAIPQEIEEALHEGVEMVFLAAPERFERDAEGRLSGVLCSRMVLGEPDESGRRRPMPSGEPPFLTHADTVLLATGEVAELEVLPGEVVNAWEVEVDGWGATALPFIFAGGDVAGHDRTVAHALGAGKRGAMAIDRVLTESRGDAVPAWELDDLRFGGRGNASMSRWRNDDPVRRESPVDEVVGGDDVAFHHFAAVPRHGERFRSMERLEGDFQEVNLGLDVPAALAEAARCFACGVCNECALCMIFCGDMAITAGTNGTRFEIDYDHCKGCGICAAECPRGAITMTREGL
jgi:2-oxoacid:acceptor oxidoreductase delta subunit (pyruvate/2-ketoisovalerate family)